jgi:hypothetical protein
LIAALSLPPPINFEFKPMKKILLALFPFVLLVKLQAQDTLPSFSVRNVGNNRIIISWVNNYQMVKQISIQRSLDSLSGYKTILSVADPMTKQNGYVDVKAMNDHMFYRLFIMLDGAMYQFSRSMRPLVDTMHNAEIKKDLGKLDPFGLEVNKPSKFDSLGNGPGINKNKPDVFVPSNYVYTARDGNVHLNLPKADSLKYSIRFYDDNNQFLFEIRNLKDPSLVVDKTNFYHAGWFRFELFVNEKLKEKNKFYLEKEF